MEWRVELFNEEVKAELDALPKDLLASFYRITRLIEIDGLQKVHEPYVKHLTGPLWEMRMEGRNGIARAAYVTVKERRIIVVHVFQKKTQETPRRNLNVALRRAKEVQ